MRSTLFVYGTLCIPEVVESILGLRPRAEPARLCGWRRGPLRGAAYPGIAPDPDSEVEGELLRGIDADALARLDRYEGPEYERIEVEVECRGSLEPTLVYALRPECRSLLEPGPWVPGAGAAAVVEP